MFINEWDKKYEQSLYELLDGYNWYLDIKLKNGKKLSYLGSNVYPPYWRSLINILLKYSEK